MLEPGRGQEGRSLILIFSLFAGGGGREEAQGGGGGGGGSDDIVRECRAVGLQLRDSQSVVWVWSHQFCTEDKDRREAVCR